MDVETVEVSVTKRPAKSNPVNMPISSSLLPEAVAGSSGSELYQQLLKSILGGTLMHPIFYLCEQAAWNSPLASLIHTTMQRRAHFPVSQQLKRILRRL